MTDLLRNDVLPVQMTAYERFEPLQDGAFWNPDWLKAYELLESWGVRFGPYDSEQAQTIPATLPDGWSKTGTVGPAWLFVLDEHGRWRASIARRHGFSNLRVEPRIAIHCISSDPVKVGVLNPIRHEARVVVDRGGTRDNGEFEHCTVLFWEERTEADYDIDRKHEAAGDAHYAAEKWADRHYPDWRDPAAYWDKDILGEGKQLECIDGYWFLDGRKIELGDALDVKLIDPPKWVRVKVTDDRGSVSKKQWAQFWCRWPTDGPGMFSCIPWPDPESEQPLFRWPKEEH